MIVAAAILDPYGVVRSIAPPARHAHIDRAMAGCGYPRVEGFVDDRGAFLTRTAAMHIARSCGQLKPRNQPGDPVGAKPRLPTGSKLYSEDLW